MNTVGIDQLEPNRFIGPAACRSSASRLILEPNEIEVVQVSTVFGSTAEFLTVAVMWARREHYDLPPLSSSTVPPRRRFPRVVVRFWYVGQIRWWQRFGAGPRKVCITVGFANSCRDWGLPERGNFRDSIRS